jgi:hypothetical protein
MNSIDRQLQYLLKAAARAPKTLSGDVPFAVQARVLAQWRSGGMGAGDLGQLLLPLLRRAAICACLLMLVSIAFSYRAILSAENDEVIIANAAMDLTQLP